MYSKNLLPAEKAIGNDKVIGFTCPGCKKDFAKYKSKCKGCKELYCSSDCYKSSCSKAKRYRNCLGTVMPGLSHAKNILKKKGFFKSHKDDYKDKIVNYPDSPTGKAYIGINKEPFMPAADDGHGYQGVLIQDEDRELVQCHGCGKWCQKITTSHTKKCCGLTTDQYKEKYGLYKGTGLVSDETSLRLTKAALRNKTSIKDKKYKARQGNNKNLEKGLGKHSMEFYNRHGTCPLQLKERLYEFIRCNRELPSQNNRGRKIYKALILRYGSWGYALQEHGLPYFKRTGTTYLFVFPDNTKYKYNVNQFYDREHLYNLMMEKCQVLHVDPKLPQ